MAVSRNRVLAIARKELREYRRNRSLVVAMAVLPAVFIIEPLVALLRLSSDSSSSLGHEHVLIYLLGIPTLVPVVAAATAIAGEREQGTLEPALSTPVRDDELLLGKAIAAFIPSIVLAYVVFAAFAALLQVLAQPGVAAALLLGPDLIAQVLFTPLLAALSIWVGMTVSTRTSDVRVAQQLGLLASLPAVLVVVLIAFGVIPASGALAVGCAVLLLVLDSVGWRLTARLFDREQLIAGMR
jgi:ABC-2 type transport system permease protein